MNKESKSTDPDNLAKPEEALGDDEQKFRLPCWLRIGGSAILGCLLIGALYLFIRYLVDPAGMEAPSKLGLTPLIIFCFLGLIVLLVPWDQYGLRLRKFGPFEFEQILATQGQEHAGDIHALQQRIECLEQAAHDKQGSTVKNQEETGVRTEPEEANELRELLLEFLDEHSKWAFSPSRIAVWGGTRPGYEKFRRVGSTRIRRELQSMLAEGYLETRISRKGSTLYRVPL